MTLALDLTDFRRHVQAEIDAELARQRARLVALGPDVVPLVDAIAGLLAGGKRLRAAFCRWGYVAAGGVHEEAALRAATAMEFFQAAALLHDDVMDASDTRRGQPTTHEQFAATHRRLAWEGDPARFGMAGAILAGNLCLVWSDELMASTGWPAPEAARARPVFDAMRSELMAGQFLDMLVATRGWADWTTAERVEQARRVIRFKSAQYSVQQPLLIGAAAAGASAADTAALARYGLLLGEAFQLRDDLLGVFGDPEETGKPAGDDLREGKRTVLLALALDSGDAGTTHLLRARIGQPDLSADEIATMRAAIAGSGAPARVEGLIDADVAQARAALDETTGLTAAGRHALGALVDLATVRDT